MFCIKCGTSLPEDARFCPKCGFPVPESLIQSDPPDECTEEEQASAVQENIIQHDEQPVQDEDAEIKEFVGTESKYYIGKWRKSSNPEKAVSWNWAAFFLSGYWLGYRKMYIPLLVWFVLAFGFGIIMITVGYVYPLLAFILDVIIIGISVFLGMYGNALYYRHMERKLKKWHADPVLQSRTTLSKMGGTGWLTVILLTVANVVIAIIAFTIMIFSLFNFGLFNEGITFGTGSDDYGVTGVQDQFSANSPIYLEATFGYPVGTDKLKIVLLKQNNSSEDLIDQWSQKVNPSWESIYFNLYDPKSDGYLDSGHYIVRIYDGKDLLDEGEFDITSFSIDGGTNNIQL